MPEADDEHAPLDFDWDAVALEHGYYPDPRRSRDIFVAARLLDSSSSRRRVGDQLLQLAAWFAATLHILSQGDGREVHTQLGSSRDDAVGVQQHHCQGATRVAQLRAAEMALDRFLGHELVTAFVQPQVESVRTHDLDRGVGVSHVFEVDSLQPIDVWSFTRQVDRDLRRHLGVPLFTWPDRLVGVRDEQGKVREYPSTRDPHALTMNADMAMTRGLGYVVEAQDGSRSFDFLRDVTQIEQQ